MIYTFIVWATVFAVATLVIYSLLALFFGDASDQYLTPEQEGRISRDNELRAAFKSFTEEFGYQPSVRELWLYCPPTTTYRLDPDNDSKETA